MRRAAPPLVGSLVSGVLFCLALPPVGWWPLAWIALVPLFVGVRGNGFMAGFFGGLLTMFLCLMLIRSGVFLSDPWPGGEPGWVSIGCMMFGIVVALVARFVGLSERMDATRLLQLACLSVALEGIETAFLPVNFALTQWHVLPIVRLASIFGIWGVSFALMLSNLLVAEMVARRLEGRAESVRSLAQAWASLLVACFVVGGLMKDSGNGPRLTVAALQTEDDEARPLQQQTQTARTLGARLAVWPELSAIGLVREGDTKLLHTVSQATSGIAFVTSFEDDHQPLPHNAASLFDAGLESDRYFKRRPFGAEKRMHAAGTAPAAGNLDGLKVGLNICFDSCYPDIIRDTARLPGVGVLVLPTADPESPQRFVEAAHAAFTPFRAAEAGLPIVRADARAYSMICDRDGAVVAMMPPPNRGPLVATVQTEPRWTLYKLLGDWFLYLCGVGFLFGTYRLWNETRRKPDPMLERLDEYGDAVIADVLPKREDN